MNRLITCPYFQIQWSNNTNLRHPKANRWANSAMAPIMPAQISVAMALSLTLLTRYPTSAFTFAPSSASRVFPTLLSPRCQPSPGARASPASFSGAPARPGAALGAEQGRNAGWRRNAARRHGITAVNMAVTEVVDELVELTNPGLEVLGEPRTPGA